MNLFFNIALPINNDKLFTYELENGNINSDYIGCRAVVPLGKRTLTGVIVEQTSKPKDIAIKKIIEILDDEPIISKELFALSEWLSQYYLTPLGDILKLFFPPSISPHSYIKILPIKDINPTELENMKKKAPKRAKILEFIARKTNEISVRFIEQKLKIKNISTQLIALENLGFIEIHRKTSTTIKEKLIKAVKIPDEIFNDERKVREIVNSLDKTAIKQSLIFSEIYLRMRNDKKPIELHNLLKTLNCSQSSINSLLKKGYIEVNQIPINRALLPDKDILHSKDEINLPLTDEQSYAVRTILSSFEKESKPILLFGVTGSGKTLIYMHLIKDILSKGKSVIYLVPEIALTPQLTDRLKNAFPAKVVVVHSRLSEGERFDAYKAIRNGDVSIVLGTRSAIFSPIKNLGLIIIDEEHDSSLKQESPPPYYHARDTAIMRAKFENAKVILGSATPSIESIYNAQIGKYNLIEIKNRADGAKLPKINVIDLIVEKKEKRLINNFSIQLIDAIIERLNRKEGIILLHNRRGYSTHLECPDCGNIPHCSHCSVTLTYHKHKNLLRCHYCGYTINAFQICNVCGYPELKKIGSGTQKIEAELEEILNKYGYTPTIKRLDLDSVTKKGTHKKALYDFALGNIDILVGTQMVSKGLDIERVTLVGIINADQQLFIPDFRANERTFQLITQTAGRAGRTSDKPGYVIIQTKHPENYTIKFAANNDYYGFYKEEISFRKELKYPPFTRFIMIEFASTDEKLVAQHIELFNKYLPAKSKYFQKLGPTSPTIFKLKNYYRRIIVIKSYKENDPSAKIIRKIIIEALEKYRTNHFNSAIRIRIDVDSYSSF